MQRKAAFVLSSSDSDSDDSIAGQPGDSDDAAVDAVAAAAGAQNAPLQECTAPEAMPQATAGGADSEVVVQSCSMCGATSEQVE